MQGWISLHRKIMNHEFFKEKRKFSRFEAWIDLLLKASFEEEEVSFNFQKFKLERGQLVTSIRELSERWGWHRKTIRTYFNQLQKEDMVNLDASNRGFVISIIKFDYYQNDIQMEEKDKFFNEKYNTENIPTEEKDREEEVKDKVNEVWAHYLNKMENLGKKRKKTPKKTKHIKARLDDRFSPEELKKVIDIVFTNDYMLGKNDRKKPYLEIENFMRNTEKVEKWLDVNGNKNKNKVVIEG